jgi:protein-L-isoaspartate(D-aspartate) O-methyltransferase
MGRLEDERKELADALREKGIRNERVLRAIETVDRNQFVLPAFSFRAYEDTALPIGSGQTISQPYTVAFMTEKIDPREGDKVLEIGTGSGYQAAILAQMGCRVFTIERHAELHLTARRLLEKLGYRAATLCGDGTVGWSEFAPYDGIIVTAGAPEVPDSLLKQLADGGRLVIPVGEQRTQSLKILTREGDELKEEIADGFKFVPLIGKQGWSHG